MSTPKQSDLSKSSSLGDAVAGEPPQPQAKHATKAKTKASKVSTPTSKKASAHTGAQTTLEQAKQVVQQFAQVNAAQARDLGVQLADAEAAFPLTMMQGYQERKAELEGAGLDAATFLSGLTQQVSTLRETSVTITLPSSGGTALPAGTDAEA